GMLCAANRVKKLVFGFVTMDALPLEPHFRKARESGALEVMELDEGMFEWGLRAAGMRLPFLPTRCGLGTDVVTRNPDIKMVRSPYADGEVLLAMPALKLDVALTHVNEADRLGNTLIRSADPLFDHLFARAADRCIASTEILRDRFKLDADTARFNLMERSLVSAVVLTPGGAHPTYCGPDYGWDLDHLKRYNASAAEDNGWQNYRSEFVDGGEDDYRAKVGGMERIGKLAQPIF
ncbi:MAG: CoA transferase subunit A, partial [Rhodocyclales bacterium]|nr:CoA transferase subunit A [Rhodocyclales bacterium]